MSEKKYKMVRLPPNLVKKMKLCAVESDKTFQDWARDVARNEREFDAVFRKKKQIKV